MKREIARRWADAIESGEYKQCTGMMRLESGFCYIGILADLWLQDTGQEWVGPVQGPGRASYFTLPNGASKLPVSSDGRYTLGDWAGCDGGDLSEPDPDLEIDGIVRSVSEWNDARGPGAVTPKQVADAIRSQYFEL